jgi:hypothetical protein
MLQTAPLISLPLPLAITLHQFRVLLAALFLIMGMLAPPLLLAVAHDLAIFRVSRQFLAVIISAAPALTLRLAADHLLRAINGRQKRTLAVRTTAELAQADSPQRLRDESSEKNRNNHPDANIETNLEFVPHPRRWELSLVAQWLRPKPAKMAPFVAGADEFQADITIMRPGLQKN